jgi:hypothetical protein
LIKIFNKFNPKTRIYVVADCCHSGSILDLPYSINNVRQCTKPDTNIKPHIILLSGCTDPETAAESYNLTMNKYCGALTSTMNELFRSNSMNGVGLVDFHRTLSLLMKCKGFSQNIVLSSSREITNEHKMFL